MMQSFACLGAVALQRRFWGFSLAFSDGTNFIGDLNWMLLLNYKTDLLANGHKLIPSVPILLFCIYQMMFAIITPALISGSICER
jgi:Amt family ammonium transporter